jgi:hypothetical protein
MAPATLTQPRAAWQLATVKSGKGAALGCADFKGVIMRKPFTLIGALLLLLVAGAHIYRAVQGIDVGIGNQMVPMMVSYGAAALFGIVALLQIMELRK